MNLSVSKKKIGVGAYGSVFESKFNTQPSVFKIEPLQPDDNLIEQEKQFALAVHGKPGFLKLVSCGYMLECKTDQPVPKWLPAETRAYFRKKNKSNLCAFTVYQPRLSITPTDQMYMTNPSIMTQIYNIVKTLRAVDWSHGDIHAGNIMMDNGGKVYLIDYGLVSRGFKTIDISCATWLFYNFTIPEKAKFDFNKLKRSAWWRDEKIRPNLEKVKNKEIRNMAIVHWAMINNPDQYAAAWDHPIVWKTRPKFHDNQTMKFILSFI